MKALIIVVAIASLIAGCMQNTPPQAYVKAPDLPPPAAPSGDSPSKLTYGTANSVKKNVTTQTELMELFGGPDVMTTDKDGTEVWMYDKTTSTVSGEHAHSGSQAERSEAGAMAAGLGIALPGGVGGVAGGVSGSKVEKAEVGHGTDTVTRTAKTITFIIKFNADKTVKDYAVRQSKY